MISEGIKREHSPANLSNIFQRQKESVLPSSIMLKYLCLLVLVSQIHSVPVDDTAITDAVGSHDDQDADERKPPNHVEILESGSDHQSDGSYSFHYRGADGTFREETAVVKNAGTKKQHLEINGAYSFIGADGKEAIVHYKADDRGFVPVGSNIPDVISLAARENSQLPAVKKDVSDVDDDDDDVDDADVEDGDVTVLKEKET